MANQTYSTSLVQRAIQLEETELFAESVAFYLKAIQNLTDQLANENLTRTERLEVQYDINTSISRSQLLLGMLTAPECTDETVSQCSTLTRSQKLIRTGSTNTLIQEEVYTNNSTRKCHSSQPSAVPAEEIYQEIAAKPIQSRIKTQEPLSDFSHHETGSVVDKDMSDIKARMISFLQIEKPDTTWSDVVGMKSAKQAIRKAVLVPVCFPDTVPARNSWKGVLLFGPSGVGKTLLIKAVAAEAQEVSFMNIRMDSVMSKWQGESEKSIRAIFEIARERSPCIVFIDEIDAICGTRSNDQSGGSLRLKNALVAEMDGMDSKAGSKQVIVVGKTNQPQALDQAFLRRFNKRIFVPLPTESERKLILLKGMTDYQHGLMDKDFKILSLRTEGYSGADLATLISAAGLRPMEDILKKKSMKFSGRTDNLILRKITMGDFLASLKKTPPTNDQKLITKQVEWAEKFCDCPNLTQTGPIIRHKWSKMFRL